MKYTFLYLVKNIEFWSLVISILILLLTIYQVIIIPIRKRRKFNIDISCSASPTNDDGWYEVCVSLRNIGKLTLKDFSFTLEFEEEKIEELSSTSPVNFEEEEDCVSCSPFSSLTPRVPMTPEILNLYIDIEEDKRVHFEPNYNLNASRDTEITLYMKPRDGVKDINASWEYVSDDYRNRGKLIISV